MWTWVLVQVGEKQLLAVTGVPGPPRLCSVTSSLLPQVSVKAGAGPCLAAGQCDELGRKRVSGVFGGDSKVLLRGFEGTSGDQQSGTSGSLPGPEDAQGPPGASVDIRNALGSEIKAPIT